MRINKTLLTITFLLLCKNAFCQEFLTPLKYNPALAKHASNQQAVTTRSSVVGVPDTTSLPFWDDFSYSGRYPSSQLWMDSEVYIDDNYGVNPPTIGVAVFDGLNKYGQPYDTSLFSWGGADTLTSRVINLRNYSPADSIYLSFFYQPQGNGDSLESDDSLVLEFRDTSDNWDEVWGVSMDTVVPFQQVLIRIDSLQYFSPGFQFRFRNYAILSGNNNNWCIDYVKMDKQRFSVDTLLHDEAFQYNSQSILKNYTQMPWNQFYDYQDSELRSSYSFITQNNINQVTNVAFSYSVVDLHTGNLIYNWPKNSALNIDAETDASYSLPLSTYFTVPTSIAYVNTQHYINTTNNPPDTFAEIDVKTYYNKLAFDQYQQNDTVHHIQYFYNYYAYDDGSAEVAYSLLGNGEEAPELAYQFSTNKPNTVRAIQIFFAYANADDSNEIFVPQVWSSVTPENVIYTSDTLSNVIFNDSLTGNGFHTYILNRGVPVNGTFYVGFLQTGLNPMYVGYDLNDNDSEKLYYNVGSGFQQSQFYGAVMIRPVMGDSLPPLPTGIAPLPLAQNGSLKIYPNPTKDMLTVNIKNTTITDGTISIENIIGQTLLNYPVSLGVWNSSTGTNETIDVSALPTGMYFLHLADNKGNNSLSTKFVKIN